MLFPVLTVSNLDILPSTVLEPLCVITVEAKNIKIVIVNCNKEGHPSISRDCSTFLSKKIIIQNETLAV